jgi:hypothetical protein
MVKQVSRTSLFAKNKKKTHTCTHKPDGGEQKRRRKQRYLLVAAAGGEAVAAGLDVDGEDLQSLVANPGRLLRNHLARQVDCTPLHSPETDAAMPRAGLKTLEIRRKTLAPAGRRGKSPLRRGRETREAWRGSGD